MLDNSFVITIDDKRYQNFCKRFEFVGLNNPLPKKFIGFQIQNGVYRESGFIKTKNICNCWFSHIAIVSMANALGWDFVCIFEDDTLPANDVASRLDEILSDVPDDADIIKFGHLGVFDDKPITEYDKIFDIRETRGSHAYVIFKRFYDKFIEITKRDILIDHTPMNDKTSNILTTKDLLFV